MKVKSIKQSELTSECWLIQIWGLSACKTCEVKDTEECGGKAIRKDLLESGKHGKINIDGLKSA